MSQPTFFIIPHTHWEGAVFKTREDDNSVIQPPRKVDADNPGKASPQGLEGPVRRQHPVYLDLE